MRTLGTLPSVLWSIVLLSGCASGGSATSGATPATEPAAPAASVPTSAVPAAASADSPSSEEGVGIFSQAQADRGRSTFRAVCAECHYSSEFRGTQFQFSWRRRTVADFFDEISSTMPEDAPGSLDPSAYLDVVAYVLELNGFPTGDAELPLDETVLNTHSMAAPARAARER